MSRVSLTHPQLVPVPIPDAVATLIGRQIPERVLQAEVDAMNLAYNVTLCRGDRYRETREQCLADLARANKTLAAWDPRLIVGGGTSLGQLTPGFRETEPGIDDTHPAPCWYPFADRCTCNEWPEAS
ncbi:hypothetical protein [Streptomyces sp. B6(2022)]|uniref:hypothetical protein n=1 Tax=Streptomyces sp. B6(2022) TaxID=3404749 RepID=UPI00311E9436